MTMLAELLSNRYDPLRRLTYVALDVPSADAALRTVTLFENAVDGYKVGLELFHGDGQRVLSRLADLGKRVFLDVKLHDIPHTVAAALTVIADSGVEMVNVHALGGRRMLTAARAALDRAVTRPLLIGVTVLTSLSDADVGDTVGAVDAATLSDRLFHLCCDVGLDGVVTSGVDVGRLSPLAPRGFEFVVPGTRPLATAAHDQSRVTTPTAAVAAGATRLVLGRAVTQAADPLTALQHIWEDVYRCGKL